MKKSTIIQSIRFCILNRVFVPCLFLLAISLLLMNYSQVFLALVLLSGIFILLSIFLLLFPKLSRVCWKLRQYGNLNDLLEDAEEELNYSSICPGERLYLTPKYLIQISSYFVYIIPLESVLWVFRLNNMRFSFSKKREVMSYHLRITTIVGETFQIRNRKKEELDQIMNVLIERYPNFFYGYSEEHDEMVHYILKENKEEQRIKHR